MSDPINIQAVIGDNDKHNHYIKWSSLPCIYENQTAATMFWNKMFTVRKTSLSNKYFSKMRPTNSKKCKNSSDSWVNVLHMTFSQTGCTSMENTNRSRRAAYQPQP